MMKEVLAIVVLVAVSAQGKYIPELQDRIVWYPDIIKKLGHDALISSSSDRIIGGTEVTPNSVPWQIGLTIDGNGFCGGSIINANFILTAAHCCENAARLVIVAGDHDRTVTEASEQSRSWTGRGDIVHPQWDRNAIANDICIFELSQPLDLTKPEVQPICLNNGKAELTTGKDLVVTGWGKTNTGIGGSISPVLNTVTLKYLDNAQCKNTWDFIIDSTLCCSTSAAEGKGTCNGDSGGPLVSTDNGVRRQVGIVSFGTTGCSLNNPVGFGRVSSFFEDGFIQRATGLTETDLTC